MDAERVGVDELGRSAVDRAIDVRLSRQVDDVRHPVTTEDGVEALRVGDVPGLEGVPRIARHVLQVREVPGVGELVVVDDVVARIRVEDMPDEVRADEPGAAGDEQPHGGSGRAKRRCSSSGGTTSSCA